MPMPLCPPFPAVRKPQQPTPARALLPTLFLLSCLCLSALWARPALAQAEKGQTALQALDALADKTSAPLPAIATKPGSTAPEGFTLLEALEPASLPAQAGNLVPRPDETLFRPKDGSFSLLIPKGWDVGEGDSRARGGEYELRLTLPGPAGLDYVLFSLRRVAAPHKTPERFLHDLQHPRFGGAGRQAALGSVTLPGLSARPLAQVETRSLRSLIGFPDAVPIVTRTLVLPRHQGYFALSGEVPLALEQRYGPALERLRQSCRIVESQLARPEEVSPEEYAVYAAFLTSGGVPEPEKPEGAQKERIDEVVPYLRETARSRTLFSGTVAGPELTPKASEVLARLCGGAALPEGLAQDYAQKRGPQALLTDRLLLPGLSIWDEESDAERGSLLGDAGVNGRTGQGRMAQPELMGRLSRASYGDPLSVSRVAFSRDGQSALFYVRKLHTSPGTTHFVRMQRREGRWTLCGALMDEMRIY